MNWELFLGGILSAGILAVFRLSKLEGKIAVFWYRRMNLVKREQYRALNVREPPEKNLEKTVRKMMYFFFGIIAAGFFLSCFIETIDSGRTQVSIISRPDFGKGDESTTLWIEYGNMEYPVSFDISENKPKEKEADAFFEKKMFEILKIILGENESFERIQKNMNLIQSYEGIMISWNSSDETILDQSGQFPDKPTAEIPEEGKQISLTAKLSYGEYEKTFHFPVTVWPAPESERIGKELEQFLIEITGNASEDAGNEEIVLPKEFKGESIVCYGTEKREYVREILATAFLMAFFILFMTGQQTNRYFQKRKIDLERDYPEIVNKLAIMIRAGQSIQMSWLHMVQDYEEEKTRRCGFEEMRLTAIRLKTQPGGKGLFGEFGRHCGNFEYIRFGNMLEQSLKKGSTNLADFLENEAANAFSMRKNQAKKAGEEASTKLMIPMMMIFVLVIAIVIVPSLFSMGVF